MAQMTKLQQHLLTRNSPTYNAYYNGKMSYALHGKEWATYVEGAFPDLGSQQTSENIYKDVIDLYADNLAPVPEQLRGFSNVLVPLLSRGECPVVVDSQGTPHFPEHYEMISDGRYTVAAIFTRSLEHMEDYVTFATSDGTTELWVKPVPDDLSPADRTQGYQLRETLHNNTLYRFALRDKGFGGALAALQDRHNHSILDQTVVAEMYARPFWYLLNTELPPSNPYLPAGKQPDHGAMAEQRTKGSAGRIFTTSSEGPFGQLTPPTIGDMIAYHDSLSAKVSSSTGIPDFFFSPGTSTPPSGVALKILSKRFNNKIARMREDIEPQLLDLAEQLGVTPEDGAEEIQLWPGSDDLLQDALDQHGLHLAQMGYPLDYIAEVVTPGVDLDDYQDDGFAAAQQLTPSQIAAYAANPGQQAGPQGYATPPAASGD